MTDIDDKELDALSENAIGLCEDVRQRAIKSENEEVKYDTGDKHLDYEAARAFSDLAAAITALRARLAEAERERDRLRSANSIITGSDPSAYERYMAADTEFWDAIDAARAAAQEGGE